MKRKIAWIVMAAGLLLLISCKPEHTTGWITPTVSANTPTPIVVPTCTPKATPTPDAVAVSTEKPQPTVTTVPTENLLPSPTSTVTPLPTASPSPSPTPTEMPLARPTPTATPIPTVEPTPTATPIPTVEPSPTVMPIPTLEPSPTVMPIPTLEPSPTMTPVPTLEPSPTATPTPMLEPSPTATPTPTLEPSPTATPTPTAEPSPTSTPTPSPSPTPTVNPEPLINNGWQKNVSIDENYIIAFPEMFRESVVEKEEKVLSISYTCKEDADIEFQIRYCIQQTYEDVKNDILARNGMITEEYPELRRCSYALQENGKLYEGIMIESKYSYSLLGSAFGEEEWVNGVMQVVFSYPDNQTAKYDAEQYNYYVVENREE